MSVVELRPATRAMDGVLAMLESAGIEATRDAGAFFPQPVGVLVGLPSLTARGLSTRTFEVLVWVVSGDPLNATETVDRLCALADDVALALGCDTYTATAYRSGVNAEPLPAIALTALVTVTELEG